MMTIGNARTTWTAGIILFASLLSSPSAMAVTVNLDAKINVANSNEGAAAIASGNLVSLFLSTGLYRIAAINGQFTAYRFGDLPLNCDATGTNCGDGWTISYNVFDALGTKIQGFGFDDTFETPTLALQKAQSFGAQKLNITSPGSYYFSISDGVNSTRDNTGGVSLNVTSEVSAVPTPLAFPLLASALGALGFVGWRKKQKVAAAAL